MPDRITINAVFSATGEKLATRLRLLCRLARAAGVTLALPTPDPERFRGWYWTGAKWEKTCSHDQAAVCWQTLVTTAPAGSRLAVLPKEIDPNTPTKGENRWELPVTSMSTLTRSDVKPSWRFFW